MLTFIIRPSALWHSGRSISSNNQNEKLRRFIIILYRAHLVYKIHPFAKDAFHRNWKQKKKQKMRTQQQRIMNCAEDTYPSNMGHKMKRRISTISSNLGKLCESSPKEWNSSNAFKWILITETANSKCPKNYNKKKDEEKIIYRIHRESEKTRLKYIINFISCCVLLTVLWKRLHNTYANFLL